MNRPLDLARIMAEHGVLHWCCGLLPDTPELWSVGKPPCLPYRLAAEVDRLRKALRDVTFVLGPDLTCECHAEGCALDIEASSALRIARTAIGADDDE